MPQEEWLDAETAARLLGLPTRLVYAMIRTGHLPALQFPVRIRRQDLKGCLERCRIKPGDLAHLVPNADRRGETARLHSPAEAPPTVGRRNDGQARDSATAC